MAFSNGYRRTSKTFKEINEINSENLRMVQAKSIKALYDVEGMTQNKFSKLDALPPMYANNFEQPKVNPKFFVWKFRNKILRETYKEVPCLKDRD